MNQTDKIMLAKLRVALQRHDCRINSRTGLARCKAEVERITGVPLSETPARLAQQINVFCDRGAYADLPRRPFVPMTSYDLFSHQRLAEMTR